MELCPVRDAKCPPVHARRPQPPTHPRLPPTTATDLLSYLPRIPAARTVSANQPACSPHHRRSSLAALTLTMRACFRACVLTPHTHMPPPALLRHSELMNAITLAGIILKTGLPSEAIVDNMIRRVLLLVREAYSECVAEDRRPEGSVVGTVPTPENAQTLHVSCQSGGPLRPPAASHRTGMTRGSQEPAPITVTLTTAAAESMWSLPRSRRRW